MQGKQVLLQWKKILTKMLFIIYFVPSSPFEKCICRAVTMRYFILLIKRIINVYIHHLALIELKLKT